MTVARAEYLQGRTQTYSDLAAVSIATESKDTRQRPDKVAMGGVELGFADLAMKAERRGGDTGQPPTEKPNRSAGTIELEADGARSPSLGSNSLEFAPSLQSDWPPLPHP